MKRKRLNIEHVTKTLRSIAEQYNEDSAEFSAVQLGAFALLDIHMNYKDNDLLEFVDNNDGKYPPEFIIELD